MKRAYYFVVLILSVWYGSYAQNWYPQIDTTTDWTVGSFGGGALYNATKKIWTNSTTREDRTIFYGLSFRGVSYGGQYYTVSTIAEYTSTTTYGGSGICYYGRYAVDGINRPDNIVVMQFFLNKNGNFTFSSYWESGKYSYDGTTQAIIRADYDLGGSTNDICEVATNLNGVWQWQAQSQDLMDYAAPALQASDPNTIENNALFRIVDVSNPANQLFAVFQAYGGGRTARLSFMNVYNVFNDNYS